MDWLGSEFTPFPLIDPRRTFLASLVLASKFLLDKALSKKAWAKLSGLEALEVGKCKRALGMAPNWHLWVGREALAQMHRACSRSALLPFASEFHAQHVATDRVCACALVRVGKPHPSSLHDNVRPACSSSAISTIFTQGSTPSSTLYMGSEPGSEADGPQGYKEFSQWTYTPKLVGELEDMLHGSPLGYPSATTGFSTHTASEPVVRVRPVLPPFRSCDRPPLRHGPSDMVMPQIGSNMGYVHAPAVYSKRASHESPLADTDFPQGCVGHA